MPPAVSAAATRQQKAVLVQKVLSQLYPHPPIPLNHFDTFSFLVAVVLSAQTTDGKVNEVTKELFQVAPTPDALSAMSPESVEKIIKTVGLAPSKAKYLVNLSSKLVRDFSGVVPSTYAELESLPGVGHKTASVIMSQAFGEPAIAVDTHVHRLALRWGLSQELKNPSKVQADLCSLYPKSQWNDLHLQMIYFGREYCTAKQHENAKCPICSWVNTSPLVLPPSLSSLSSLSSPFSPQKKTKGIVHYADRKQEISASPGLVSPSSAMSPSSSSSFSSLVPGASSSRGSSAVLDSIKQELADEGSSVVEKKQNRNNAKKIKTKRLPPQKSTMSLKTEQKQRGNTAIVDSTAPVIKNERKRRASLPSGEKGVEKSDATVHVKLEAGVVKQEEEGVDGQDGLVQKKAKRSRGGGRSRSVTAKQPPVRSYHHMTRAALASLADK